MIFLRTRLLPSTPGRSDRRRGIANLWFIMIGLPLVFMSAGLSFDVTQAIVVQRQAGLAAQSAANAGALQIDEVTGRMHDGQAGSTAGSPCQWPVALNAAPLVAAEDAYQMVRETSENRAIIEDTFSVEMSPDCLDITTTVEYRNRNFIFLTVVLGLLGEDASQGLELSVERSASVCDPNVPGGPTEGECDRPLRLQ